MAGKKSGGSLAWKIVLGVLVALLVIILIAEFGLRWFIGHQMTEEFKNSAKEQGIAVTEDPSISFGGSPLLFGLLRGSISQVDMTTPSTLQIEGSHIKGQPAAEIHAKDLSTDTNNPVAGFLRATTTVPDEYLLASFQKGISDQSGSEIIGNMVVTEITANDQGDELEVKFGGGVASLSLKPSAHDGKLEITTTKAAIFGLSLPEQATSAISDALQDGLSKQLVAHAMQVESVDVGDGQLTLTVTGTDVPVNDLEHFSGDSSEQKKDA
ncbi:DUF2993 domain-containing protein [Corynebacterium macginleyi]|uniref:LmeA family phospholipid-binding protein n=1 Tax=Corynebacterium macginleyi TaxID=38290 RepID=UPI001909CFE4|nr:DUF2993 domain-containing protein [Corynebacterium macginleyi]MBK4137098.1 LmeA family phospholipid-binding protein [Corynebacterium macginleyi]MBM0262689.1 DUF2993 domain-containing protein [Corynebacterium macginleyi]